MFRQHKCYMLYVPIHQLAHVSSHMNQASLRVLTSWAGLAIFSCINCWKDYSQETIIFSSSSVDGFYTELHTNSVMGQLHRDTSIWFLRFNNNLSRIEVKFISNILLNNPNEYEGQNSYVSICWLTYTRRNFVYYIILLSVPNEYGNGIPLTYVESAVSISSGWEINFRRAKCWRICVSEISTIRT
jgi:hypothetical protein